MNVNFIIRRSFCVYDEITILSDPGFDLEMARRMARFALRELIRIRYWKNRLDRYRQLTGKIGYMP